MKAARRWREKDFPRRTCRQNQAKSEEAVTKGGEDE